MLRYLILAVLCFGLIAAGPKSRKSSKGIVRRQSGSGSCGQNEFQCNQGWCIDAEWTCDSDNDCGDNSDETLPDCPPPGQCTGPHEFHCPNDGSCMPIEFRCDGDDDCGDGSDESDCDQFQCSAGEWKCNNGLCIEGDYVCDGDNDCGDGSDETPQSCATTPVTK